MARAITTDDLRKRLAEDDDVQLVEVLPKESYQKEHLPGAVSIPLAELTRRAGELDPARPVVTYCFDTQCDLSARAASLLAALGFREVLDYTASKVAWFGSGHASAGDTRDSSRAGFLCRPIATCAPEDRVGDVIDRFDASDVVVVVDDERVVLGLLRQEVVDLPADTSVMSAMQPAPATVRPSVTASELAGSMERDRRRFVLVTTLHGQLLGIIGRDDLHGVH